MPWTPLLWWRRSTQGSPSRLGGDREEQTQGRASEALVMPDLQLPCRQLPCRQLPIHGVPQRSTALMLTSPEISSSPVLRTTCAQAGSAAGPESTWNLSIEFVFLFRLTKPGLSQSEALLRERGEIIEICQSQIQSPSSGSWLRLLSTCSCTIMKKQRQHGWLCLTTGANHQSLS